MPKVSTQVYMLDSKSWKFFRPRGNGRKRTKCDQFYCPTSDFFDFCNPCFFYRTFYIPMMWVLLTKPMQKSVTTVCLHCSFARLKNKQEYCSSKHCNPRCRDLVKSCSAGPQGGHLYFKVDIIRLKKFT